MILKMAWKNIWRKKLRSSVVITSIIVGLVGGILYMGIMNGMMYQRIGSAIATEVSHIQIHNEKFLENEELKFSITNSTTIINKLKKTKAIRSVCSRIITTGMASTARTGSGVEIIGINPDKEKTVSNLYTKLIDSTSSYFNTKARLPILIGERLAKKLNAKRKSKIILTFQSASGELTGGAFKVVGIFRTQNSSFDEMKVFVRKADIAKLVNIPTETSHEIAIMLKNDELLKQEKENLKKEFKELTVSPWQETMPELGMMEESMNYMLYILMIIILLAIAFGIVNTMLMVVFERTKELGMLMCIGLSRKKVFSMILLETMFLSITGGIIGLTISVLLVNWLSVDGIDLSIVSEGLQVWGYDTIIYPDVEISYYINTGLLVVALAILSAIYPARKAIKLKPVEAVRIDN